MGHMPFSLNLHVQFGYEYDFRPVILPSVAATEVFQDLKTQADGEGFSDSQVAFELAACYFNGCVTDTDMHLGLEYFSKSVVLGNLNAIGSATNVFEACGCVVPSPIREIVGRTLNESGSSAILPAISSLCILGFPVTVDHANIQASAWARLFPAQYSLFTGADADERHVFNHAVAKLFRIAASPKFAGAAHRDVFDFEKMRSYRMEGHERLPVAESEAFVAEVRRLGCLNSPNEYGLTLLQTAVSRGDLPMVTILVHELQADVNEIGNTRGWTPLWLSCLFGCHNVAMFLRDNGADPTCRDTEQGTTILHTLTQFSEVDQVRDVVEMALSAGVDINVCASNGMTPLHATFAGWDYSRGAAAQVLLERGADPTRQVPDHMDFMTPIGLCMRNLDAKLLESMISAAQTLPGASGVDARRNLGMAKAQAFRWLGLQTRFYFMCAVGRGYEAALTFVLRLIMDEAMMSELASSKLVDAGSSPLQLACHFGRSHIVRALVEAVPNLDLDSIGRPCLHLAIERRSRDCVQILINQGAKILQVAPDSEQNALHVGAKYFPSLVPQLAAMVDAMSLEERGGKSTKEVLDLRNKEGFSVFGLLLAEGYSQEKDIAESIRSKYNLDYDSLVQYTEGDYSRTLLGVFAGLSIMHGLIPIGQLRYLLDLSPQPIFVCASNGSTLLTAAVAGWMSRKSQTICPCS